MNEIVANAEDQEAAEKEFEATRSMYKLLQQLGPAARTRVLTHVVAMLGIVSSARVPELAEALVPTGEVGGGSSVERRSNYGTFAEFFAAVDPQTEADKALAAGYWIQELEGADSFDALRANKELKHLGHSVGNITVALSALMDLRPALVLQLRKSGSSKQARKTYKVTGAGVTAIKDRLDG